MKCCIGVKKLEERSERKMKKLKLIVSIIGMIIIFITTGFTVLAEGIETEDYNAETAKSDELESIYNDFIFKDDKSTEDVELYNGEEEILKGNAAFMARSATMNAATFSELQTAISNAPVDGTETIIEISSDIIFSSTIEISDGKNLVIKSILGKNYMMTCIAGRHFNVKGSLMLSNIILDGEEKSGGVSVAGAFTMNDGAVICNSKADKGGGVYIDKNGNFKMNGGTIWGNKATDNRLLTGGNEEFGGGVYVNSYGNFTMTGGEIHSNYANYGGGVDVDGDFNMSGGTIWGNSTPYQGGAVGVYYGTFTMTGGTIRGNKSKNGGGVHVASVFNMNGGSISENSASSEGGGVCLKSEFIENGKFHLNGGSIVGNNAQFGGGVYVNTGIFIINDGNISANRAKSNGGGVYLSSLYQIAGGSIISNNPDNIYYAERAMDSNNIPRPTGVSISESGINSLKISWKMIENVQGYEIFYSNSKNGAYKKVGTTDSNYYICKNLTIGKIYYFKIRSYIKVNGKSYYSKDTGVESKKVILSKPAGFKAKKKSSTSAKLLWKKISGATSYEIYRSEKKGKYKKIATVKSSKTSYIDKKLKIGKTYYYKIRTVKKIGKNTYKSKFTDIKTLKLF